MNVKNVFNLVHRFGSKEDQISASFGFMLQNDKYTLIQFLKEIGITNIKNKDISKIDIEAQVSYDFGESRIDLQIKLVDEFLIFLEAKINGTQLGSNQLEKYAKILHKEKPFYKTVSLAFITQFDRLDELTPLKSKINTQYPEVIIYYNRWKTISELIQKTCRNNYIRKMFDEYVGDMMADKRIISEQKIKDLEEVMIVTTSDDFWKVCYEKKIAMETNGTRDAQYVAFYRTAPIKAITHIGKVKYTEKNVLASDSVSGSSELIKIAKEKGWYNTRHKEYHLESIEELPKPIPKGKYNPPQVLTFKPLIKVLTAKTMEDLK